MSLYDDFDKPRNSEKVAGWSSGIKLLQSQLQLKKAATTQVNIKNDKKISKNCRNPAATHLKNPCFFSRNVNNTEKQLQCLPLSLT